MQYIIKQEPGAHDEDKPHPGSFFPPPAAPNAIALTVATVQHQRQLVHVKLEAQERQSQQQQQQQKHAPSSGYKPGQAQKQQQRHLENCLLPYRVDAAPMVKQEVTTFPAGGYMPAGPFMQAAARNRQPTNTPTFGHPGSFSAGAAAAAAAAGGGGVGVGGRGDVCAPASLQLAPPHVPPQAADAAPMQNVKKGGSRARRQAARQLVLSLYCLRDTWATSTPIASRPQQLRELGVLLLPVVSLTDWTGAPALPAVDTTARPAAAAAAASGPPFRNEMCKPINELFSARHHGLVTPAQFEQQLAAFLVTHGLLQTTDELEQCIAAAAAAAAAAVPQLAPATATAAPQFGGHNMHAPGGSSNGSLGVPRQQEPNSSSDDDDRPAKKPKAWGSGYTIVLEHPAACNGLAATGSDTLLLPAAQQPVSGNLRSHGMDDSSSLMMPWPWQPRPRLAAAGGDVHVTDSVARGAIDAAGGGDGGAAREQGADGSSGGGAGGVAIVLCGGAGAALGRLPKAVREVVDAAKVSAGMAATTALMAVLLSDSAPTQPLPDSLSTDPQAVQVLDGHGQAGQQGSSNSSPIQLVNATIVPAALVKSIAPLLSPAVPYLANLAAGHHQGFLHNLRVQEGAAATDGGAAVSVDTLMGYASALEFEPARKQLQIRAQNALQTGLLPWFRAGMSLLQTLISSDMVMPVAGASDSAAAPAHVEAVFGSIVTLANTLQHIHGLLQQGPQAANTTVPAAPPTPLMIPSQLPVSDAPAPAAPAPAAPAPAAPAAAAAFSTVPPAPAATAAVTTAFALPAAMPPQALPVDPAVWRTQVSKSQEQGGAMRNRNTAHKRKARELQDQDQDLLPMALKEELSDDDFDLNLEDDDE